MKLKNLLLGTIIAISAFLLVTNKAFAEQYLINISGEGLNDTGNNAAKTASFDADTNTLTLNNFEGDFIKFNPSEEKTLKIILKGTNKISGNPTITGIDSEYGVLIESAEGEKGTLVLENLERGICSYNGDITINNIILTIKNTSSNAIIVDGSFKTTNANITINNVGNDSSVSAIHISGDLTTSSNINISNVTSGIEAEGSFIVNKGKVIVNATDIGILSYSEIKLNGGYTEAKVEENKTSIAALGIGVEPAFTYKDGMVVSPSEASIKTSEITTDGSDPITFILKTLGYEGLSFDLDLNITSAPSHIIIQEVYNVKFDANGGTGQMEELTGQTGVFTLPDNKFKAPDKKQFKGWSLEPNGDLITSIELTEDVTFYAIWEDIPTTTTKKNIEKEANPATGDNVLRNIIIGIISLVSLSSTTIYLRKNN